MQVHNDARFRQLSAPAPSAQFLWLRLLTSPESVAAPGLIPVTRAGLAEKLGWKLKDLTRCFNELTVETDEHEHPLALADWSAGLVFLPKAVEYNPPASPNAVKAWVGSLRQIPECDLRTTAIQRLAGFLEHYSEQFQLPMLELLPEGFRYPGAGAGAGAGKHPKALLVAGPEASAAALDAPPPLPDGSGTGAASAQPSSPTEGEAQEGGAESPSEWDLDLDDDPKADLSGAADDTTPRKLEVRYTEGPPPTTGIATADGEADGDGWRLESPTVPLDGKKGVGEGCTICSASRKTRVKPRAAGLLFRQIDGRWFAAMCWACIKIGCQNEFSLPIPPQEHQSIAHWKCFEHALPEHVRSPKKKRDEIVAKAIARTRDRLGSRVEDVKRAADRAADEARANEPDCEGCGYKPTKPGLVYRQIDDTGPWHAALCPVCGGSSLHRAPPTFMGPPIPTAELNGAWVKLAATTAPKDAEELFKWQQGCITETRNRMKAGKEIPGIGVPLAAGEEPAPTSDPEATPESKTSPPEEPVTADVAPPETGIDSPDTGGDDEFNLDDDVPL